MLTRLGSLVVALLLACWLSAGCSGPEGTGTEGEPADSYPGYIEHGDLPELRERGRLRVLMPPLEAEPLPRRGSLLHRDLQLARALARRLGLELSLRRVSDRDHMLEALLAGGTDLVLAPVTVTPARSQRFAFSVPVDHVREILVVPAAETAIGSPADLEGRSVAVREGSLPQEALERLKEEVPGLRVEIVPDGLDEIAILEAVARGEYEAGVIDDRRLEELLEYRNDLRAAFPLTPKRPRAWAMRTGSVELKRAVDHYLREEALNRHLEERLLGDLEAIRERKVLRVLTRNTAATYFLHRGKQVGFEFELARRFAQSLGCRIQVIVPPSFEDLIPWLLEGRGDLIAAGMTVTSPRAELVAFGRPYAEVEELLVARAGDDSVGSVEDLEGREVAVVRASAYRETLEALQAEIDLTIVDGPPELDTEGLVALVADGAYDLTVSDSTILAIELSYRENVQAVLSLGDPKPVAWAVRPGDRELLAAIDAFVEREYRGEFYNVLRDKYFGNRARIAPVARHRAEQPGVLSPYDEIFRRFGDELDIDWRLLAAQSFQESRFRPQEISWAGAEGLMQVLPRTAREMGVEGDLHDPETGIRAGALYLRFLVDFFDDTLPFAERMRFALASYNVGLGHVLDGRRLAIELGLDPNRWYGHVEEALPLLRQPFYASRARNGYCRCVEPVDYVSEINNRYLAYSSVID